MLHIASEVLFRLETFSIQTRIFSTYFHTSIFTKRNIKEFLDLVCLRVSHKSSSIFDDGPSWTVGDIMLLLSTALCIPLARVLVHHVARMIRARMHIMK